MKDDFMDIMDALDVDDTKDTIDLLKDKKQAEPYSETQKTQPRDNSNVSYFDLKEHMGKDSIDSAFSAFDNEEEKTEEPTQEYDESLADLTPADRVFVSDYTQQEQMKADEYRSVYRRTPHINGQPIQSRMGGSDAPRAASSRNPNASYRDGYRYAQRQDSHKQPKAKIGAGTIAALLALCILVSGLAGFGGSLLAGSMRSGSTNTAENASIQNSEGADASTVAAPAAGADLTTGQIVEMVADSVVEITTEARVSSFYGQYTTTGAGSGVIIREDGYIITNNHVVDGASSIKVTTRSGESYDATVLGTDSVVDIALLKIDATGLTFAQFGNSDEVKVGDKAVVIGNPLGDLGGSVTEGIISALDRTIVIDDKQMHLMQTDAAINPGNSGGGTFNGQGKLIGIVVAKSSNSSSGATIDNIGFVIPINSVESILGDLEESGYVKGRPDSGMEFVDYYSDVYISSVRNGSNAASAGFREGDRVISVDSEQISSASDVESIINSHAAGDTIDFVLARNTGEITLSLTLEEKTQEDTPSQPESGGGYFPNPFGFW